MSVICKGLGEMLRVWGYRVQGTGFRVQGAPAFAGRVVQGAGFKVQGAPAFAGAGSEPKAIPTK